MKRKQCHFNTESNDHTTDRQDHQRAVHIPVEAQRQICHIQRSGLRIQKSDAQKIHRCPDRPHQKITKGCNRPLAFSCRDQSVAGERGDFHENIEVERIARRCHTQKPDRQTGERRVI